MESKPDSEYLDWLNDLPPIVRQAILVLILLTHTAKQAGLAQTPFDFANAVFVPLLEDPGVTADNIAKLPIGDLTASLGITPTPAKKIALYHSRVACAAIAEALHAHVDEDLDHALAALSRASHWCGVLRGFILGIGLEDNPLTSTDKTIIEISSQTISDETGQIVRDLLTNRYPAVLDDHAKSVISARNRLAADAAHATNRKIRKEAYQWLDDHFDQDGLTNDRAAEALKKIVPMELSTRLRYVKDWKKSR